MFLGYLDESYAVGDHYSLGLLLVPEQHVAELNAGLRAIAGEMALPAGLGQAPELHGHDVLQGAGEFRGVDIDLRFAAYWDTLSRIAAVQPILIIIEVPWVAAAGRADLAHHRLQGVEALLEMAEATCIAEDARVLIVADREEGTEPAVDQALDALQQRCAATGQTCRILERVLFQDSHKWPGIQACDMALYIFERRKGDGARDPRATRKNRRLWELIQPWARMGSADR
jgi:hypothetical protein